MGRRIKTTFTTLLRCSITLRNAATSCGCVGPLCFTISEKGSPNTAIRSEAKKWPGRSCWKRGIPKRWPKKWPIWSESTCFWPRSPSEGTSTTRRPPSTWPDGSRETLIDVPANQTLTVRQIHAVGPETTTPTGTVETRQGARLVCRLRAAGNSGRSEHTEGLCYHDWRGLSLVAAGGDSDGAVQQSTDADSFYAPGG